MGIKNLMSLLKKKAPKSIQSVNIKDLKGETVAFDASLTMYQFLISTTGISKTKELRVLTDSEGNQTAHLLGLLHRTNKL